MGSATSRQEAVSAIVNSKVVPRKQSSLVFTKRHILIGGEFKVARIKRKCCDLGIIELTKCCNWHRSWHHSKAIWNRARNVCKLCLLETLIVHKPPK